VTGFSSAGFSLRVLIYVKSGNANLPAAAGGWRDAIQENGVPGRHHQVIAARFEAPPSGRPSRVIRIQSP
jgi:hypothetical protein